MTPQANNQRFIRIKAGEIISAGLQVLGNFNEANDAAEFRLRKLRLWFLQPYVSHYEAMLTLPGNAILGPIDLPCFLNVETPVSVFVRCAVAQQQDQEIICTIADLPDSPNLYGATYLLRIPGNEPVMLGGKLKVTPPTLFPIPDGVVAVTEYDGGTLTFYDSTSSEICSCTGPQLVARPRLAKFVSTSATGPSAILFHY